MAGIYRFLFAAPIDPPLVSLPRLSQPIPKFTLWLGYGFWLNDFSCANDWQERQVNAEIDAALSTVACPLKVEQMDDLARNAPPSGARPKETVLLQHGNDYRLEALLEQGL